MANAEDTKRVIEIIDDTKIGMFSTHDEQGTIVSRPLVAMQVEDDASIWFITDENTSQAKEIGRDNRVNVTFGDRTKWISVSGAARLVRDTAKTRELWNQMVEAWFPDGPETPGVVLIHVDAQSAEYWETNQGVIATAFKFAKARITDEQIDIGESHEVEL